MTEEKNIHIVIETDFGAIEVRLFDDTPLHRDNMVKLINDGFYDGQSFHRIIKDFMIQGGEIQAQPRYRNNDEENKYDYAIPAEILFPKYFHKKGVLAAARLADNINPKKESSSTQFYIVTGETFDDAGLNLINKQRFEKFKQSLLSDLNNQHKEQIKEYYRSGEKEKLNEFRTSLIDKAASIAEEQKNSILISEEQRLIYKTEGGAPHLDSDYTIFGEVLNGIEIIDKIQEVPTDKSDRPKQYVKFNILIKK